VLSARLIERLSSSLAPSLAPTPHATPIKGVYGAVPARSAKSCKAACTARCEPYIYVRYCPR
jgi:hypothetical protein